MQLQEGRLGRRVGLSITYIEGAYSATISKATYPQLHVLGCLPGVLPSLLSPAGSLMTPWLRSSPGLGEDSTATA